MGKRDTDKVFDDISNDVKTYAKLRFELLKLNTYEQSSRVIAFLSYGLLLSALILIVIFLVHLTLGFFISHWLGSYTLGFGIITILYLIQVIVVFLNKDRIKQMVANNIIKAPNYYEDKIETTFDNPEDKSESEQETGPVR
jgi:hypothetical protein